MGKAQGKILSEKATQSSEGIPAQLT